MGAQNEKQQALQIRVYSGEAQSIQLFDFQSERRQECEQILQFPSKIAYSEENGITYINEEYQDQVCEPIFDIKEQEYHKIVFQSLQELDFHNQLWRVINTNQKFPLYQGDELKLGKIKIKLKSIVSQGKSNRIMHEKEQTQQMNISINQMEEVKNSQQPCRICFDANQTHEDPLLSLCHCSGTVKNIHFQCLKDWITNSVQRHQSSHCLSYSYIEAKCQLCKKKYENQFYHNGSKFMLYQFEKLKPPYALFQNMNIDESMDKNRISVFMIKLEEGKEIQAGRNASSEVILNDISVSRSHCLFSYQNGQLFIKDKKSKFGTLIRSPGSWEFQGKEGIQLQIGSKLIKIDQEKTLDNCCCSSKPYQLQLLYSSNDGQL